MGQIAENAHATGDPGIVFMDRINRLNRVTQLGSYKTVVPCGEVSLHEGEVCQFGYLNLVQFLEGSRIDQQKLRKATQCLVIMLDNAVEANTHRMPNEKSRELVSSLRRIGIGVCGFAELLQAMGIAFDSPDAKELAANIMSLISFESKWGSVYLAQKRGAFKYFEDSSNLSDLFIEPFAEHPTSFVKETDWKRLKDYFLLHKIRNVATTMLAPTGRCSLLAGVTGSIEPSFRLFADPLFKQNLYKACKQFNYSLNLDPIFTHVKEFGTIQNTRLPSEVKNIFKTALEISPKDHLEVTEAFQRFVDEGISKTVNLPHSSTVKDVMEVFLRTFKLNLKGIAVFRDGCRNLQPKALKR